MQPIDGTILPKGRFLTAILKAEHLLVNSKWRVSEDQPSPPMLSAGTPHPARLRSSRCWRYKVARCRFMHIDPIIGRELLRARTCPVASCRSSLRSRGELGARRSSRLIDYARIARDPKATAILGKRRRTLNWDKFAKIDSASNHASTISGEKGVDRSLTFVMVRHPSFTAAMHANRNDGCNMRLLGGKTAPGGNGIRVGDRSASIWRRWG